MNTIEKLKKVETNLNTIVNLQEEVEDLLFEIINNDEIKDEKEACYILEIWRYYHPILENGYVCHHIDKYFHHITEKIDDELVDHLYYDDVSKTFNKNK